MNKTSCITMFKIARNKPIHHHHVHMYHVYTHKWTNMLSMGGTHHYIHIYNAYMCTYAQVCWVWENTERNIYLSIQTVCRQFLLQILTIGKSYKNGILQKKATHYIMDNQSYNMHFCDLKIIMSILFPRNSKYKI